MVPVVGGGRATSWGPRVLGGKGREGGGGGGGGGRGVEHQVQWIGLLR